MSSQIGNGSLIQRGIKVIQVGGPILDGRIVRSWRSLTCLDDLDRELGAVGFGEIGLFFQFRGNRAVIDLACVAILVEFKQLRAIALQRLCPWHLSLLTRTFSVAVLPIATSFHVRWSGIAGPVWRMPTAGARTRRQALPFATRHPHLERRQFEQWLAFGHRAVLAHEPLSDAAGLLGARSVICIFMASMMAISVSALDAVASR